MNRTLAKYSFLFVERIRRERVDLNLRELERNQKLPRSQIRRLQQSKLETLLRYVISKNDFYREKYRNIDPLADFAGVPVLGKQELRERFQDVVTKERASTVQLVKTSGSTGEPLKFYRDRIVFGYTLASVFRAHKWYGIDIGAREAMLWGIPANWKSRLKMRARDLMLNRFRETDYNLDPLVLLKFYRDIRSKRPEYIYGYSSMVYEFALFVREQRLPAQELGLKGIVCTAESIHDYQRAVMESVFACKVISEYGSAETGVISYQCPNGRHHVSDDCVLLEVIDDDGRPVPVGQVGKVTVTVLNSFAAPIIRYQLGDLAALSAEVCDCGVNLSLIERIVGRTSGIIVTPEGRCFHSIALYYIMKEYSDRFGGVRQFRVRQTHIDRLEFHIAAGHDFTDASRSWIETSVKEKLGVAIRVEFFIHEHIERSTSGKLSDFESCLDMEDHLIQSYHRTNPVAFGVDG